MATMTLEERVSRLEGGFEHLATKADVAELRGDLHALEIAPDALDGGGDSWIGGRSGSCYWGDCGAGRTGLARETAREASFRRGSADRMTGGRWMLSVGLWWA